MTNNKKRKKKGGVSNGTELKPIQFTQPRPGPLEQPKPSYLSQPHQRSLDLEPIKQPQAQIISLSEAQGKEQAHLIVGLSPTTQHESPRPLSLQTFKLNTASTRVEYGFR